MTDDTDPCMWKGCAKRAMRAKNFCPEHVAEITEASSKPIAFLGRAPEAIGWGIVGNAIYQALSDVFSLNSLFQGDPGPDYRIAGKIADALQKEPRVGVHTLMLVLDDGRLQDHRLGPAIAQYLIHRT
jgi:hypothetical protein